MVKLILLIMRHNPDADFWQIGWEMSGLPRIREKSGKFEFFQGQGIVREFCKLSGKFGIFGKCQGTVREF